MNTSESIIKIAPALLAAQRAITFASRDTANPFFKSRYADLPAVIDAVKPALNDNGIVFVQTASPCADGMLALTTRLIHSSGEWIEDTAVLPLPKPDPQGYGSAMTYARRYSLAAITGLYQDDDNGQAASIHPKQGTSKPVEKPTLPGDRFNKALAAVSAKTFSAEKLRSQFKLTTDQETVLNDLVKGQS